jgi:hypothetical protein
MDGLSAWRRGFLIWGIIGVVSLFESSCVSEAGRGEGTWRVESGRESGGGRPVGHRSELSGQNVDRVNVLARELGIIVMFLRCGVLDILLRSLARLEWIVFHIRLFELSHAGSSGARADITARKAFAPLLRFIKSQKRSRID